MKVFLRSSVLDINIAFVSFFLVHLMWFLVAKSQKYHKFSIWEIKSLRGKQLTAFFSFFFCIIVVMFKISAELPSSLSFSYEKVKRSYSRWLLPKLLNAGCTRVASTLCLLDPVVTLAITSFPKDHATGMVSLFTYSVLCFDSLSTNLFFSSFKSSLVY